MVWIARIILGILLLIFIRKRPNLSILLGIGLFILYVNDDNTSKSDLNKNIPFEKTQNQIPQSNYIKTLELNNSRTSKYTQEEQSSVRFLNERDQKVKDETTKIRVGAVCNDGTISYATGRGACSHHGGVANWRYE